jgi:wyosine [tRNA(Phe)-imidazoG37] synthetase (radical SAM superfamily)
MFMNRFVFGPVPSRRLGFSLGVDIIPKKYCTLDCVYCQVGKTTKKTVARSSFFSPEDIVDEIVREVHRNKIIDVVTFSGSGEPTLNKDLGAIVKAVKKRISTPIAVITNGTLLNRPDVRNDVTQADVLMPSLDAGTEEVFLRINKPASSVRLEEMIEGLKALRSGYQGQIWLEIMLIHNINDTPQHLELLKETVGAIGVDKIHLNTVTRPPCEETVRGISQAHLSEIQDFFGPNAEVICGFRKDGVKPSEEDWETNVLAILKRRSLTLNDIVAVTGVSGAEAERTLNRLLSEGRIAKELVEGALYYLAIE